MTDDFDHVELGLFRADWNDNGWRGRGGKAAETCDLFVMEPGDARPTPSEAALERLTGAVRTIAALKAAAVERVCAARQARLNWREGPAVEAWSVVELRIDRAGALWLTLHEYETDEYSRWLVAMHGDDVRRIPALALKGDPTDAGELV
jgi:hypothetical protein